MKFVRFTGRDVIGMSTVLLGGKSFPFQVASRKLVIKFVAGSTTAGRLDVLGR